MDSLQQLEKAIYTKYSYDTIIPGLQEFYCEIFKYKFSGNDLEMAITYLSKSLTYCNQLQQYFTDRDITQQLNIVLQLILSEISLQENFLNNQNKPPEQQQAEKEKIVNIQKKYLRLLSEEHYSQIMPEDHSSPKPSI